MTTRNPRATIEASEVEAAEQIFPQARRPLRILNVIYSLDENYGGPIKVVADLAAMSAEHGIESHILNFGERNVTNLPQDSQCIIHFLEVRPSSRYWYVPKLKAWLQQNVAAFDGIILHGMWLYPNYAVFAACRQFRVPYAYFPHGMLEPWSFNDQGSLKMLKKRIYWELIEKKVAEGSSRIFFTSKREMREANKILRAPLEKSIVTPYGIDIEQQALKEDIEPSSNHIRQPENRKVALFLGRIHPHKHVELLLNSWALAKLPPDWHFVVAGPGDPIYLERLKRLATRLRIANSISFVGPLWGKDKLYIFRRSRWSFLASEHENFGVAAIESISSGCPVAMSDNVYLSEYLHEESIVLPLQVEAWACFMRTSMQDEETRQRVIERDQSILAACFEKNMVAANWASAIRETFAGKAPIKINANANNSAHSKS